jgi:Na+-transporting methylmalonyl-CoA/oxaloacetate decarboxylase gamma subunit
MNVEGVLVVMAVLILLVSDVLAVLVGYLAHRYWGSGSGQRAPGTTPQDLDALRASLVSVAIRR